MLQRALPDWVGPMIAGESSASASASRNGVLAALAAEAGDPMIDLAPVRMDHGGVVHEIGRAVETVFFPVSCVVSVATRYGNDALDVTTVGREGLVSLPGLLGSDVHGALAVCRVAGEGLLLPVATARQLLVSDDRGLAVLHRYVSASFADLMQRLACNRVHSNEQRCACWLLKTQDRVGTPTFRLTHATLATMLGVRRATVSESLATLQRRAVVSSQHGTVTVLDRAALEAAACDCYQVFRQNFPSLTG